MKDFKIKILLVASFILCSFAFTQKATPQKPITVYIFLSETCPICQSYTLTLKDLYKKYKDKEVTFIGVFPNYYADSDQVKKFKAEYSIPFGLVVDGKSALTKHFSATITPEVFVENAEHQVLYSGRIDDSFYSLGKRRKVITSNDLDDALNSIVNNQKIKSTKTQAVGCIITTSK